MLKSLNGLLQFQDVSDLIIVKRSDDKLVIATPEINELHSLQKAVKSGNLESFNLTQRYTFDLANLDVYDIAPKSFDNSPLREPYDRIIMCLGFKFDYDLFDR